MWTAFASTAVTSSMFLTAPGAESPRARDRPQDNRRSRSPGRSGAPASCRSVSLLILPLPLLVYLIYPPEIRSSQEVSAWAKEELARMGPLSRKEAVMGALDPRWRSRSGSSPGIGSIRRPSSSRVIALLVLTRVLDWDDVIGNRAAWDTLIYFATLLALAEGLERLGIVAWAAQGVSSADRRLIRHSWRSSCWCRSSSWSITCSPA